MNNSNKKSTDKQEITGEITVDVFSSLYPANSVIDSENPIFWACQKLFEKKQVYILRILKTTVIINIRLSELSIIKLSEENRITTTRQKENLYIASIKQMINTVLRQGNIAVCSLFPISVKKEEKETKNSTLFGLKFRADIRTGFSSEFWIFVAVFTSTIIRSVPER